MRAEAFLSASEEAELFNTLQKDIPRCYFWFLYILCSEPLYKELPPLFLSYLFNFFYFFLVSYLPAFGSFPQWEDNPESSRGSFDLPLIFPNSYTCTQTYTSDREVLWELLFAVSHALALN